jgi:hypothetical protein
MQIDDAISAADAAEILGVFGDRVSPQAPLPRLRCPAEARQISPLRVTAWFWDVSGIGVVRKSIYCNVDYSHEVAPSTGRQCWPNRKVVL